MELSLSIDGYEVLVAVDIQSDMGYYDNITFDVIYVKNSKGEYLDSFENHGFLEGRIYQHVRRFYGQL